MLISEYWYTMGGLLCPLNSDLPRSYKGLILLHSQGENRFSDMPPVKVLAVTKNQTTDAIRSALASGIEGIAENRVQEALSKHSEIGDSAEWHFIGHLQINKVRQIVPFCHLIHSVDSKELALAIEKSAAKMDKRQDVLMQINISGETAKFGVSPSQTADLATFISTLEHVRLCGCMTIAPLTDDAETTRPVFRNLFNLFTELKALRLASVNLIWLSMGMTNDYQVAIEEGANLVRIGTGIFGNRR